MYEFSAKLTRHMHSQLCCGRFSAKLTQYSTHARSTVLWKVLSTTHPWSLTTYVTKFPPLYHAWMLQLWDYSTVIEYFIIELNVHWWCLSLSLSLSLPLSWSKLLHVWAIIHVHCRITWSLNLAAFSSFLCRGKPTYGVCIGNGPYIFSKVKWSHNEFKWASRQHNHRTSFLMIVPGQLCTTGMFSCVRVYPTRCSLSHSLKVLWQRIRNAKQHPLASE